MSALLMVALFEIGDAYVKAQDVTVMSAVVSGNDRQGGLGLFAL